MFNDLTSFSKQYSQVAGKDLSNVKATYLKWNKLNPFLQNERVKNLYTQPGTYSKKQLSEFLAKPGNYEPQLRAAGWTNSASQQIYYNMLRRASDIPLYKYYLLPAALKSEQDYKKEDFVEEYKLVLSWLKTFNVPCSLKTMALEVKREGKQAYILRNKISNKEVKFAALEKMPTEWIKITGIGQLGYTISFNMMYFLNMANSPDYFGDYISAAWEDMCSNGIFDKDKKEFHVDKAKDYKFSYHGKEYGGFLETVKGKDQYLYWLKIPFDMCFTFASDNSHPWCAPDTMGTLRSLQELTDYGKLAGLIASTPLTAILTGEVPFIQGARAGKNETMLSPEVISGLQDIFNATTSTNIEAMFFPLNNIKLQQLATDVNSSEIISAATENFVETSGEGGLTVTTNKPNVSQVKTAQLLAESAQQYVTEQFSRALNYIISHKLSLKYKWNLHIWGGIFTFEGEKKYLKEQVSGGNVALLPKLMSAEDMDLFETKAAVTFVKTLDFYKDFKTFTQEYQADQKLAENENKPQGSGAVGRPKLDDSEVDNDSTAKDRDNGTNVAGNREDYSRKCPICGGELEEGQEICEECFERISANQSEN